MLNFFQNHALKASCILRLEFGQHRKCCQCFKLLVLVLQYFAKENVKGALSICCRYVTAESKGFIQKSLYIFIFHIGIIQMFPFKLSFLKDYLIHLRTVAIIKLKTAANKLVSAVLVSEIIYCELKNSQNIAQI